jgi:hypothetical protein
MHRFRYPCFSMTRAMSITARTSCAIPALFGAAVALLALLPFDARADDCREIDKVECPKPVAAETARGLGLGTGVRASAISTSALAYSPGALSLGNLYHIEGNVDYMSELKTVALGAAVVDSSTSKLGAGIGLRGFLAGEEGLNGFDGRLGIALSLSDAFSIGVGARYIDLTSDISDGDETIEVKLARGFTMDASLRVIPTPGVQIDIGTLNFIDRSSPYVPTTLTGSLALAIGDAISAGADVLADMTSFEKPGITLGLGGEYLGGNTVPVRLGYSVDLARKIHALGAGIGYTDQQIGLDIGLRQELERPGPAKPETRIMGAVRYYVH